MKRKLLAVVLALIIVAFSGAYPGSVCHAEEMTVAQGDTVAEGDMVLIPGGTFQMGSADYPNDGDRDDEKPVHTVTVDGFYMGKYEVTNAQYRQFDSSHNSKSYDGHSLNGDSQPVVYVSWWDAIKYCNWRSRQDGLEECYNDSTGMYNFGKKGYRLPTEAEWEYAARGGLKGNKYPWGNSISHDQANYSGTGGKDRWKGTAPVGSFEPNGYGLYDMAGNVWEWCNDWYGGKYYSRSVSLNPPGPEIEKTLLWRRTPQRVIRGGSWLLGPTISRCAERYRRPPVDSSASKGFRLARTP